MLKRCMKNIKIEVFFAAFLLFIAYNWCIGVYNAKAWQYEDALLVVEWKKIGAIENFQIIKFNKSDYFFMRRNLYVRYKFDKSEEEIKKYYEKKLMEIGWEKKSEEEQVIMYEKEYYTGEKNKKLIWNMKNKGEGVWDVQISFY